MFDWGEYLTLAEELRDRPRKQGLHEACGRTAVSRAYYAAYCHIRNREAERRSFEVRDDDAGERGRLFAHLRKTKRTWHDDLSTLWRQRVQCDYHDDVPAAALRHMVDDATASARRILDSYP